MRACAFGHDSAVFTLCTVAREPSFLIKWAQKSQKYQAVNVA